MVVEVDASCSVPDSKDSKVPGDVWHAALENLPLSGICYGYKVSGEGGWETGLRWDPSRVLDPYAPFVSGRREFAKRDEIEQFKPNVGESLKAKVTTGLPKRGAFDWGDDSARTPHHLKDLVIYELPLKAFTSSETSGLPAAERGSFKGVAEKAGYLASLGVTAVELLPVSETMENLNFKLKYLIPFTAAVFEYDELELKRLPNPREHMVNVWGYSHIHTMSPNSRFATAGVGPVAAAWEFKEMVKTLHDAGVEVLLDVAYNHTAEGDDQDPYVISLRGIENSTYYMMGGGHILNYSGCGNTVNVNHLVVMRKVLDSLVKWVTEYHVDGFRFDLSSAMCRDGTGNPLASPPVIREISKHPVLSKVKLIAEPWDCGGLYQVGSFPNWDVWAEWNGKFRDAVRRFIKGMKKAFATRLCGSSDLYQTNQRKPFHSINFVIAHDGFSLHDLVAYNGKHNDINGEGNNDGSNDNFSWNCGVEGSTGDPGVLALRERQMRNMMVALMISQGTPMMYGHYADWTFMKWNLSDSQQALLRFCSGLIKLRKQHPALARAEFVNPGDYTWHEDAWDDDNSRFLAFTIHDKAGGADLYVAFNAHTFKVDAPLPLPPSGKKWCRIVDTNLSSPKDFTVRGNNGVEAVYGVESFASIVLIAK
ncbi:glycoside hydrolase superfamily [Dunaliella salina]|uniref:Glycoside hydrolase superfamily n=1 Tax=Dunaliella salina TaxID=3046 RepID=A0ABQ7FYB9_DUNSA|nr:glycoside hydrolase superfamily [Dunaliella salina]|eukprot:KAF5827337.1 glycoside hydrolase superfamily [Dunaliella salina]